jgi:hypothetical protein
LKLVDAIRRLRFVCDRRQVPPITELRARFADHRHRLALLDHSSIHQARSAFRMTSTEFANASTEKMGRCRKILFGLLFGSRSVGERLTKSTRTMVPLTVI